jgi:hypothetical protein
MLDAEASSHCVSIEVSERVATIGTKAHDQDSVRSEVGRNRCKDSFLSTGGHERHHVASQNSAVEWLCQALLLEVELGKVGDQPPRTRVILSSCGDQLGVSVDPDDLVAALMQPGADPAWAAAGIEDA